MAESMCYDPKGGYIGLNIYDMTPRLGGGGGGGHIWG
jgi:hypothetical protein